MEYPTYDLPSVELFMKVPQDRLEDCLKQYCELVIAFRKMITDDPEMKLKPLGNKWVDDHREDCLCSEVTIHLGDTGTSVVITSTNDAPKEG